MTGRQALKVCGLLSCALAVSNFLKPLDPHVGGGAREADLRHRLRDRRDRGLERLRLAAHAEPALLS
jgi:hypothetical protein